MNIKIPLPRIPTWLTQALDRYSAWAEVQTGQTLRIGSWRYQVMRMDYVSVIGTIGVCVVCSLMWNDWFLGFALGGGSCIAAWTIMEWK